MVCPLPLATVRRAGKRGAWPFGMVIVIEPLWFVTSGKLKSPPLRRLVPPLNFDAEATMLASATSICVCVSGLPTDVAPESLQPVINMDSAKMLAPNVVDLFL